MTICFLEETPYGELPYLLIEIWCDRYVPDVIVKEDTHSEHSTYFYIQENNEPR